MNTLMAEWKARKVEEAEELHDRVVTALYNGRVDLVTDARMLDHSGTPVHSPWDHLAPLLLLMFLALLILLFAGMAIGIVAMFACALIHLFSARHFVAWRIQRRTVVFMVQSLAHWQMIWDLGGVALVAKGGGELPCFAPTGDWRKFVRRLLPAEGEAPPQPAAPAQPVQAAPPPPPPPPPVEEPEPVAEEEPPPMPPHFPIELEG